MKKYSYACGVPLLGAELKKITNLCEKYESSKSALLRRFLIEGLETFEENNNFSLNFSLEYMSDIETEKPTLFYVSEDVAEKLKYYSNKTKMSIGNVARYFIVFSLERGNKP